MKRRTIAFALGLFVLVVVGLHYCCHGEQSIHISIGMKKGEIISQYGKPSFEEMSRKTEGHVLGPSEGFWDQLKSGEEYEMWTYEQKKNTIYIFFFHERDVVGYVATYPTGVAF